MNREGEELNEYAIARKVQAELEARQARTRFIAGMVIAAAGLGAAFTIEGAVYIGFGAAMVGTGLVPFEKIASVFKK